MSEAIIDSGHKYVSIDLLDLQATYDDDSKLDTHMIGAFNELKNCKGFNRLGGLSTVDDYKSIKLSKPAMTADEWTNKDWMAVDLLLGYPAVQKSRWHNLVLATSKKQRKRPNKELQTKPSISRCDLRRVTCSGLLNPNVRPLNSYAWVEV